MNDLLQQLKQYAELRLELFRLSAAETVIKAASSTAVQLVLGVFLLSSVLMAELALGLYLGEQSGRWSLGFAWMAAGNLMLFFMAVLLKKPILHSIQNGLSKFVKKP